MLLRTGQTMAHAVVPQLALGAAGTLPLGLPGPKETAG